MLPQPQRSAIAIQRPADPILTPGEAAEADTTPVSAIASGVIGGGVSWAAILTADALLVESGTLTALETVALIGGTLSGAGAVVLFSAGVGAIFFPEVRAQLSYWKSLIGVITSPAGLPVYAGMQAMGQKPETALKAGEFAKATLSAYSAEKALADGIKTWKEAAVVANDIAEVSEYFSKIVRDDRGSDDKSDDSEAGFEEFMSSGYFDSNGQWHMTSFMKMPSADSFGGDQEFGYGQGGDGLFNSHVPDRPGDGEINYNPPEDGSSPGEGEIDEFWFDDEHPWNFDAV